MSEPRKTSDAASAPSPESSRAAQRRLQVIEAASHCVSEHGFHGTSMSRIANAAGMSVGHIYHYFTNKNEVIAAIVEHQVQRVRAELKDYLLEPSTIEAMITQVDKPLRRATQVATTALFMEIIAESYRSPVIKQILQKAEAAIHRDRIEVLTKALPHLKDARLLDGKAELIATLMHGLHMRAIIKPNLDKDTLRDMLSDTMRHILK